ncbi:MAG: hypothetical protein NTU74_01820 [Deltaproteobacteria bacterium]|nr:hypothetical protein [Deltaproteobacteria bacterium]
MKKGYRTDVQVLDSLADKWPSNLVARAELDKLTGGILHGRTMANIESREDSDSIPRFRAGKKVFYQVSDVIDFLKRKIEK